MLSLALLLMLFEQARMGADVEHWRLGYATPEIVSTIGALEPGDYSDVVYAWAFSARAAPRRFAADGLPPTEGLEASRGRLTVAVDGLGDRSAYVIAAPVAMWEEVPEDLLPRFPASARRPVTIPTRPGTGWRLRVVAEDLGTWWQDVPAVGHRRLSVRAARPIAIEVYRPDGGPVLEAGLLLFRRGTLKRAALLAADDTDDGTVRLPSLPAAEEVTAVVTAPGLVPAVLHGRPTSLPGRVTLGAGATVVGRLVDPDGAPVDGAEVWLQTWLAPGVGRPLTYAARVDADGAWRLDGIPRRDMVVFARAEGYGPVKAQHVVDTERYDVGTLVLEPATSVLFRIVDPDGQPLAGAQLALDPGGFHACGAPEGCRIGGLAPSQPLGYRARAPVSLAERGRLHAPLAEEHEIVLRPAFEVRGRLVTGDGLPPAGGTIRIHQGNRVTGREVEADGSFVLVLEPGKVTELDLGSAETIRLRLPLAPGTPGEQRDLGEITLPTGLVITGRTVDGATGEAVAGARVWLPRASSRGAANAWVHGDVVSTRSAGDGTFSLRGLARAQGVVRVEGVGYARVERELAHQARVDGDEVVDLGDIALLPGVRVRVRVEGAETAEAPAVARIDPGLRWQEMDFLSASVNEGAAVFEGVPAGPAIVSVVAGGRLWCEERVTVDGRDDLEVLCRAHSVRVFGLVTAGGEAVQAGRLLWRRPGAGFATIVTTGSTTGLREQTTFGGGPPQVGIELAADGTYDTDRLRSGRWQVSWLAASAGPTEAVEVDIAADQAVVEVNLAFPGMALAGRVVDANGEPSHGARVRDLGSGLAAVTDSLGRFSFHGIAPERTYYLQARDGLLESEVVERRLPRDHDLGPVALILGEPDEKSELVVRVLTPDGLPASSGFVFVAGDGTLGGILTLDAAGHGRMSLDPPLPTRLRLAASTGGHWYLSGWQPWEEGEPVVIELAEAGTLVIESRAASGIPTIVSASGWDVARLLARLGRAPVVGPETRLWVGGLAGGVYTVTLEGRVATATVEAGRETPVRLD